MGTFLVFLWNCRHLFAYTVDDAYITLRYSRNFAQGHGLVYNLGERVQGYTNPLWTLWLALSFRLGCDPVLFVKLSSILCVVLTGATLFALSQDVFGRDAAWPYVVVGVYLLNPDLAISTVEGLETALFTFLLTAACASFVRERYPFSGLFLALLTLTRPDGAMFGVMFLLLALWLRRPPRYLGGYVAGFALIAGGWLAWQWNFYGYPWPNTYYAKGGGSLDLYRRGWEQFATFFAQYGSFCGLVLLVGNACAPRRSETRLALLSAAGIVGLRSLFAIWSGGAVMGHYRFLMPELPFLCLLLLSGAVYGTRLLLQRGKLQSSTVEPPSNSPVTYHSPLPQRLFQAGGIALALWSMVGGAYAIYPRYEAYYLNYAAGLQRAHIAWGQWLATHTPLTCVTAQDDAGAAPFYSGRENIDMLGLTDAHIAHLPGQFTEKFDVPYVLSRHPNYIVLSTTEEPRSSPTGIAPDTFQLPGHRAMYLNPAFRRSYRLFRTYTFRANFYLLIFARLPHPLSPHSGV